MTQRLHAGQPQFVNTSESAGPWAGATCVDHSVCHVPACFSCSSAGPPAQPSSSSGSGRRQPTHEADEDLEVETLDEPMIRPGVCTFGRPSCAVVTVMQSLTTGRPRRNCRTITRAASAIRFRMCVPAMAWLCYEHTDGPTADILPAQGTAVDVTDHRIYKQVCCVYFWVACRYCISPGACLAAAECFRFEAAAGSIRGFVQPGPLPAQASTLRFCGHCAVLHRAHQKQPGQGPHVSLATGAVVRIPGLLVPASKS